MLVDSIHLYSNRHSPSVFHPTPWYLANIAKFRTFGKFIRAIDSL